MIREISVASKLIDAQTRLIRPSTKLLDEPTKPAGAST
jgi:hypothetical protein